MKALIHQLTLILSLTFAVNAFAFTENDLGGSVQAVVGGKTIHFPALKTDIRVNAQGDLATVTVTQTFANPTSVPLNATYLFPLNKDAAVHAMTMEVGDEIIQAQIQKEPQAAPLRTDASARGTARDTRQGHRPIRRVCRVARCAPA